MYKFALIGKDISHSKSEVIYRRHINQNFSYEILDIQSSSDLPLIDELASKFNGINITSPYKEDYLDKLELTDQAKQVGAINCISFFKDRPLATNTDIYGIKAILPTLIREQIIVLGDGVMARVVASVLKELKKDFKQLSRRVSDDFHQLNLAENHKSTLVINCCSREFIYSGDTNSNIFFWDLNYSMPEHKKVFANSYFDGLSLLEEQAIGALKFWGIKPD